MKKIILLLTFIGSLQSAYSQEVYFYTGKNFTTYNFKNSSGTSDSNTFKGTGNLYEVGFSQSLNNEKFSYSAGLALNEYNSVSFDTTNDSSWETQYIGLQAGISYSIIEDRDINIVPQFGLNLATLVSGKQYLDKAYYNLSKEKEFSGLLATPSLGIQVKYNLSSDGFVSLGYNYCKGFNLSNSTEQKITFNTSQLQFGVHYNIR
nr:outer membrane beta-barrel protein [uncultured Flavobacterium sp.]